MLADAGYLDGEDIQFLDREGIIGLIPDRELKEIKKSREGIVGEGEKFKKDKFKYDSENDVYICPEGKKLYRETQKRQKVKRKNGLVVEYSTIQV